MSIYEMQDWQDDSGFLAEVLRETLGEEWVGVSPYAMDDALDSILESMSAAEAFNFAKALQQIEKGASKIVSDPAVGQVARTALPVAGGLAGTMIGGPAGTALGSGLGSVAAKAIPSRTTKGVPLTSAPTAKSNSAAVSDGSAAAAQALVLTQQPAVLKSLLATAMGQAGKKSVDGVPVAAVLGLLSNVLGQAAADADELIYLDSEGTGEDSDDAVMFPPGRSLYAVLLNNENDELAEIADLA